MAEDQEVLPPAWEGKPWGFITSEGWFVQVPKAPCINAGYLTPPFVVDTAFGPRCIIEKPDDVEITGGCFPTLDNKD